MLYNIVKCEHRVWMDLYGDPKERDAPSEFVELLWRHGRVHEEEVVAKKAPAACDIRSKPVSEREQLTAAAMKRCEPLIFGGRISCGDLLGEPDLLRRENGGYVPGDIKAGAAEDDVGAADGRPKKHYAVQLGLYLDVLERLGFSDGSRRAFVWDVLGEEVYYDFSVPKNQKNPATLWDDYQESLALARSIVAGEFKSQPAYGSICRNCWWYTACIEELTRLDDLTLIPELGRSRRTPLSPIVKSAAEFARANMEQFVNEKGESVAKGIGLATLAKYHARAKIRTSGGGPYAKREITFPSAALEISFDIETDPMRDHCYLHGFLERRNDGAPCNGYVFFLTDVPTPHAERLAFAEAWSYVKSAQPCVLYTYSKYERTWWRKLREKYPDVCSAEELEELFSPTRTVDLYYDVVLAATEWPTIDYSLKSLAKYSHFRWRDAHPSGASSIEWYDRFVLEPTEESKSRILEYNEDDCRATFAVLDRIRELPVIAAT
jgi:predicted RecB family nuclease